MPCRQNVPFEQFGYRKADWDRIQAVKSRYLDIQLWLVCRTAAGFDPPPKGPGYAR